MEGTPILSRIKRLFRPIKPVLMPIWRWLAPIVDPPKPKISPTVASVLAESSRRDRKRYRLRFGWRRRVRLDAPIRSLTRQEFDELAARDPYYSGRWGYMSVAGAVADELIADRGLTSAIELGPNVRPLIVGADIMDYKRRDGLDAEGAVLVHDARTAPWPAADKQYGLFVGLQVFEHLAGGQEVAFQEVRRVAQNAIISLPIEWEMADPDNCHHQITNDRALSWFAPVVPTRILLGNPGRWTRLVYVFEDLPA